MNTGCAPSMRGCLRLCCAVFCVLALASPGRAQDFPGTPDALSHEDVLDMVRVMREELLRRHDAQGGQGTMYGCGTRLPAMSYGAGACFC